MIRVGLIVAAGTVAAFHVGKAAIATPQLQAAFGLDLGAVGALTGIIAVLGAVGGLAAGTLVARRGGRGMLALGLGALLAGAAGGALATGVWLLFAARLLEGLGFLLVIVAGPAVLQQVTAARQRDGAFTLWSCFMPAGLALALLAGPLFPDWRSLWWGSAALAGLALAATLLLPAGERAGTTENGSLRQVLRAPGALLLAACFLLYSVMFFALAAFLPVLLIERMGLTQGLAGLLSATVIASNIAGNLLAGRLLARGVGRPAILAGASLAMALCAGAVFLPLLPALPVFLLCLLFSGVAGLIPATLMASAPLLTPAPALTVGLMMQGSSLGQVLGPLSIGAAIERFGWPAAALGVALAGGLAALAACRLVPALAVGRRSLA